MKDRPQELDERALAQVRGGFTEDYEDWDSDSELDMGKSRGAHDDYPSWDRPAD